jgi:DNA-binding beta-propeller fold protein YncE
VDAGGNLYVADRVVYGGGRIRKWDAQENWSVIATYTEGSALGQLLDPTGLAVDGAGNLYVADSGNNRVLEYTVLPGP